MMEIWKYNIRMIHWAGNPAANDLHMIHKKCLIQHAIEEKWQFFFSSSYVCLLYLAHISKMITSTTTAHTKKTAFSFHKQFNRIRLSIIFQYVISSMPRIKKKKQQRFLNRKNKKKWSKKHGSNLCNVPISLLFQSPSKTVKNEKLESMLRKNKPRKSNKRRKKNLNQRNVVGRCDCNFNLYRNAWGYGT